MVTYISPSKISVGFYFAWKEQNQTSDHYLLNNDGMNPYDAVFYGGPTFGPQI